MKRSAGRERRYPFIRGLSMYRSVRGANRMYAIGLEDGGVKIGFSKRPETRIEELVRAYGGMSWCHVFGQAFDKSVYKVERDAHAVASLVGNRRNGSEVFDGLSRSEAMEIVRVSINHQIEARKAA